MHAAPATHRPRASGARPALASRARRSCGVCTAVRAAGVHRVLDDLAADGFDHVVCDSPAGIEKGAHPAMYFADRAVVDNPEVSSVRDSDRVLGLLASKTRRAERGEGRTTCRSCAANCSK